LGVFRFDLKMVLKPELKEENDVRQGGFCALHTSAPEVGRLAGRGGKNLEKGGPKGGPPKGFFPPPQGGPVFFSRGLKGGAKAPPPCGTSTRPEHFLSDLATCRRSSLGPWDLCPVLHGHRVSRPNDVLGNPGQPGRRTPAGGVRIPSRVNSWDLFPGSSMTRATIAVLYMGGWPRTPRVSGAAADSGVREVVGQARRDRGRRLVDPRGPHRAICQAGQTSRVQRGWAPKTAIHPGSTPTSTLVLAFLRGPVRSAQRCPQNKARKTDGEKPPYRSRRMLAEDPDRTFPLRPETAADARPPVDWGRLGPARLERSWELSMGPGPKAAGPFEGKAFSPAEFHHKSEGGLRPDFRQGGPQDPRFVLQKKGNFFFFSKKISLFFFFFL